MNKNVNAWRYAARVVPARVIGHLILCMIVGCMGLLGATDASATWCSTVDATVSDSTKIVWTGSVAPGTEIGTRTITYSTSCDGNNTRTGWPQLWTEIDYSTNNQTGIPGIYVRSTGSASTSYQRSDNTCQEINSTWFEQSDPGYIGWNFNNPGTGTCRYAIQKQVKFYLAGGAFNTGNVWAWNNSPIYGVSSWQGSDGGIRMATGKMNSLTLMVEYKPYTYWSVTPGVMGGTGAWDLVANNWTYADGSSNGIWSDAGTNVAIFQGTPGTVSVSGTQSIGGLTFNVGGYSLTGGSLKGAATSNALTVANTGQTATVGSALTGGNVFTKEGGGRLVLTGANTYTGNTTLSAGTLQIGGAGSLGWNGTSGAYAGAINNINGTLQYSSSVNQTLSGTISGSGSLVKDTSSSARLTLTGAASYAGSTTIDAGTLQIGGAGTLGSGGNYSAGIVNNGTLQYSSSASLSLAGVISGTGSLVKDTSSTSTLTLRGLNSYGGTTTVNAGTLALGVNNTLPVGTVVSVAANGTLSLANMAQTLSKGLTIAAGGKLDLGNNGSLELTGGSSTVGAITGTGTITIGKDASLTLTSAISNTGLNFVMNGGTLYLGDLTHSFGTLTQSQASTMVFTSKTNVTFNTIGSNFAGRLSVSGWTSGSHLYASSFANSPIRNATGLAPLNLIALGGYEPRYTYWASGSPGELLPATGSYIYWDLIPANGAVNGGSGDWDDVSGNWTTSGGTLNGPWAGGSNIAVFDATAGGVRVLGTQSIGGLTFKVQSYAINGGVLSGAAGTNVISTTAASVNPTISSELAGANAFQFSGPGTVTLTGNSSYTGSTTITTGATLQIGSAGTLGGGSYGGDITVTGTLRYASSAAQTLGGVIGGGGALIKEGSSGAVLTLTGANLFSGSIAVNAGTLQVAGTAGSLGSSAAVSVSSGATLSFARSNAHMITQQVSGQGGILQEGTGSTTLANPSSYTGPTRVTQGALVLGGNNVLPSASVVTVAGGPSGGTLDLNGKLQTLSAGLACDGTLVLGSGGQLTLNGAGTASSIAAITGSGRITVGNGVVLTLTGPIDNSAVDIVLAGGTLNLGNFTHSLGTLTQSAASTIGFTASSSLRVANIGSLTGQLKASGWTAGSHFFATAIAAGPNRNATGQPTLKQIALGTNAAALTYWASSSDELLAGTGPFTYWDATAGNTSIDGGDGNWTGTSNTWSLPGGGLNGVWAGGTNTAIFGAAPGRVQVAEGYQPSVGGLTFSTSGYVISGLGTGALSLAQNATISTPSSGVITISAPLAGSGVGITVTGGGTLALTGTSTYTGTTAVGTGTVLDIGAGTAYGDIGTSSGASVASGATLALRRSDTYTLGIPIAGAGGVRADGSGSSVIRLSHANAYTGPTTVSTGRLVAGVADTAFGDNSAMTVANGAVLDLGGFSQTLGSLAGGGAVGSSTSGSPILTVGGDGTSTSYGGVIGNGSATVALTKTGGGSFTLTGANTYTGPTTVAGGALLVTGSTANGSAMSVMPGATLGGTGIVAGPVAIGGILQPGATASVGSVGTLNTGALTLSSSARLNLDLDAPVGAGNDLVKVNGNLVLDGSLFIASGTAFDPTGKYTLITYTGTRSGRFAADNLAAIGYKGVVQYDDVNRQVNLVAVPRISGVVFNDGGAPAGSSNTGTPNDGRQNGAEAGLAGITVNLGNCAGVTYASTATDASGAYALSVPAAQLGQDICVQPVLPPGLSPTGANAAGAPLVDGATVSVGGVAYGYGRADQRVRFTAAASGDGTLNFGQVPVSTFTPAVSAQQARPGMRALHPHTFTAGTGGTLKLQLGAATALPNTVAGWSEAAYLDANCTGSLDLSAPPLTAATSLTVVQGQQLCFLVHEQVPATAPEGSSNAVPATATLAFTNATPSLSASYTVTDTTSVSNSALQLTKEVRNVTQGGSFGINNQAKSGEVLEYRITYKNTAPSPLTTLVINDATPTYTTFVQATTDTTPPSLTACTKVTPANVAPAPVVGCDVAQTAGGTGPLSWTFTGTLNGGGTGAVLFQVKVD